MRSAARSARARPLGASYGVAAVNLGCAKRFRASAADAARNAADVRDLLRTRLSLTDAEVDRMVRHRPLGALATVAPKLVWPQRRLGLDEAQLKKVVLLNPSLLSKSIEDNLAPTLDWLQARLDLDDEQLRKMIVALPALLGYSVEDNVEPKLQWLQRRLDLDEAQLRKIVRLDPSLLNKSVEENLEPKLYFFERELLRGSRAELRDWVVKKSPCLSYSLTNRYRPRLEACRAAGVDAKRVLSYATQTDETFCERVGITLASVSV